MNKEPELVDLGLPSGNLWMKYNLGASKETEYGNYYQWGSLVGYQGEEAKKHSNWKTCPFNNRKGDFDKEYFLKNRYKWIYKNRILKPEFDIITQTYGLNYKIPTDKDFQELLSNTTISEVNTEKGGRLFTSKINGKTLFIPFSGYVWEGRWLRVGSSGFLWSGRLYSNVPPGCAYNFACNSDIESQYDDDFIHSCGLTIRGIKVKER